MAQTHANALSTEAALKACHGDITNLFGPPGIHLHCQVPGSGTQFWGHSSQMHIFPKLALRTRRFPKLKRQVSKTGTSFTLGAGSQQGSIARLQACRVLQQLHDAHVPARKQQLGINITIWIRLRLCSGRIVTGVVRFVRPRKQTLEPSITISKSRWEASSQKCPFLLE